MATSGVITGILTAREYITMAAELSAADLVGEGQTAPSAYDAELGRRHLNWLLKSMQTDGIQAFRNVEVNYTWPAATASVTFDGLLSRPRNCLDVTEVRIRTSGIDRILTRVEQDEFREISNKTQAGEPIQFSVRKTTSALVLHMWPVSASIIDVWFTSDRIIEDVLTLAENVDIPQEWTETVVYSLADRLNGIYGFSGTPQAQDVKKTAERLYMMLKSANEPASVFFSPAL